MSEVKMEHVLLFVVLAFLLYHLLGNCYTDGFSVDNEYYDHYDPIYIDDGNESWYGCKGKFGTTNIDTCPPDEAKGNGNNPPKNPNDEPFNNWRCKSTKWYEDDICESIIK